MYCKENRNLQEIECINSALRIIINKADNLKLEISRLVRLPLLEDD